MNGIRKQMPFGVVPMVRREQVDHQSDFYFCMTKLLGFSRKNKSKIVYPNYQSALKSVWIPVPISFAKTEIENEQNRRKQCKICSEQHRRNVCGGC